MFTSDVITCTYCDVSSVGLAVGEDAVCGSDDEVANEERVCRDGCVIRILALDWSKIGSRKDVNKQNIVHVSIFAIPPSNITENQTQVNTYTVFFELERAENSLKV